MAKRKNQKASVLKNTEKKTSIKRDLFLVLLSVIGTAVFSIFTTLYLSHHQQPSILVERAFYATDIEEGGGGNIPGISKIKVTNNNLSTVHNLVIPISKDAYKGDPTIIVDMFSKYSIEDNPYYALVNVTTLPPSKHVIITICGVYNDIVSSELKKSAEINSDTTTLTLNDTLINLPFLGTISADEGPVIKFAVVETKDILDQELKDGFVVNRFLGFSIAPEDSVLSEFVPVKLKESTYDANTPQTFVNDKQFMPGFNSLLVVLGARNEQGSRVSYVSGFDSLEIASRGKKGYLFTMYDDLMHFYYPGYHSTLSFNVRVSGEDSPHKITVSSDGGLTKDK